MAVDAGEGGGFLIGDTPPPDQQPPTLTRDQLVAIAANVAFDPTSADEHTWSPATTALPSHSALMVKRTGAPAATQIAQKLQPAAST